MNIEDYNNDGDENKGIINLILISDLLVIVIFLLLQLMNIKYS